MSPSPKTISDLGKLVKGKYAGQYDDLPDEELGRRIKTKFPGSYDDFAEAAGPPSKQDSALSRFGSGLYDSTIGGAIDSASSMIHHPLDTIGGVLGVNDLQHIGELIKSGDYGKAALAVAQFSQDDPAKRVARGMVSPIIDDVKKGDYAHAAGRAIGTAGSIAGPELLGKVPVPEAVGAVAKSPFVREAAIKAIPKGKELLELRDQIKAAKNPPATGAGYLKAEGSLQDPNFSAPPVPTPKPNAPVTGEQFPGTVQDPTFNAPSTPPPAPQGYLKTKGTVQDPKFKPPVAAPTPEKAPPFRENIKRVYEKVTGDKYPPKLPDEPSPVKRVSPSPSMSPQSTSIAKQLADAILNSQE